MLETIKNLRKVLFVEDDQDQIFMYQSVFELEGMCMMAAINHQEAIRMAQAEELELILLDLLLGNENGLDVLKDLKANQKTKNIPVIVFTNYVKKGLREECAKLGAIDFILKIQTTPTEFAKSIKARLGERVGKK
ncbi:response regulator [Patescibacteria group bacterium]|nr:response regulator [Patescibacteria group bacterium]MBU2264918.1 response regulator [Patescibacteria group bacterium]